MKVSLRDLIKPTKIDVEGNLDEHYGRFVCEPLERGFGITLGNALRRVLLSSLQGAAICSFKVDGVSHEFSTIPGISEDVAEVILNLKEVVPFLEEKGESHMFIDVEGPCDITASMINCEMGTKILNPNKHIATLGSGHHLYMDLNVKAGRGYIVSENNRVEGAPEGTIFIDSIFSPVRRVNVTVSNARVAQRTDYDKLVLDVWTNASVDPRAAVAQAAHILIDQLSLFVGDGLIVEEEEPKEVTPLRKVNENLYRRIDELELSVRSANCLENSDIKYVGELVQRSEYTMLSETKNFGKKSLNELKDILSEMGLSFGMNLQDFPSREELDKMKEPADN